MAVIKYEVGSGSATTSLTELRGYSMREAAGTPAPATVQLRKTNGAGDVVVRVELSANESDTVAFNDPVVFGDRIHVEVVSGTAEWSVFGR